MLFRFHMLHHPSSNYPPPSTACFNLHPIRGDKVGGRQHTRRAVDEFLCFPSAHLSTHSCTHRTSHLPLPRDKAPGSKKSANKNIGTCVSLFHLHPVFLSPSLPPPLTPLTPVLVPYRKVHALFIYVYTTREIPQYFPPSEYKVYPF